MNTPPFTSGPVVRRLKRIAPLQLGKMLACLYGAMGLVFIPFFMLMAAVGAAMPGGPGGGMFAAMGVGMMIGMPVLYAVMGFIVGVIGAAVYNLLAGWIGGIEVEVE